MFRFWVLFFIYRLYRKVHGSDSDDRPIFGVYRQNGPTSIFKFLCMYIVLSLRKLWNLCKISNLEEYGTPRSVNSDVGGYGSPSRDSPVLMDCTQALSPQPKAIDAVYFNGANKNGWHFIGATARRSNGIVNGFLYIRVPGIGLFTTPKHPDTLMFQSPPGRREFAAEGLEFKPVQPMATWEVNYNGLLRLEESESEKYEQGKLYKVNVDALWTSSLPYFDFDTDMSPVTVAKSMMNEPWSRDYFKLLKEMHQTHYEQFGELTGTLQIEDDSVEIPTLDTVRDHSYGKKREWNHFHRYALHYFSLDNGAKFFVGVVSMPVVFSSMQIGYLYTPKGKLHPVTSHTFKLHEHGEGGSPPTDYAFSFTAGGKTYHVKVKATRSISLHIGWEWEARVVESFSTCEVNGVKGWGCGEFQYKHLEGRPQKYFELDPDWSKDILKG